MAARPATLVELLSTQAEQFQDKTAFRWLVDGGEVTEFAGDLDDYTRHLQASAGQPAIALAGTAAGRKAQRRLDAQARGRLSARRKPLEAELRVLEGEVTRLAAERDRLEKLIASPDMYADSRKEDLKRCLLEQARVSGGQA